MAFALAAAKAAARHVYHRFTTTAAAVLGLVYEGGRGLLLLGGGALLVYAVSGPCGRFLGRHLFAQGSLFTPLHRFLRTRSHRASNKGEREKQSKWNHMYTTQPKVARR